MDDINPQPAASQTNHDHRCQRMPGRRRFLWSAAGLGVAVAFGVVRSVQAKQPQPPMQMINPRLFTFVGGDSGPWVVVGRRTVAGTPLPDVKRLDVVVGAVEELPKGAMWMLRGVTSNERYVNRDEKDQLAAKQVLIGRPEATHAAVIPIRKSAKWWALTQDERRAIFEEQSHHIKIGMKYLPAIARRLHHCRDLGTPEPFDFITFFDYTKADANAFEDMVAELRTTEEWKYVEREIDIRLRRDNA